METLVDVDSGFQDEADIKIILLGDTAVGKTKLIERYLKNDYSPRQVRIDFTYLKQDNCYKRRLNNIFNIFFTSSYRLMH